MEKDENKMHVMVSAPDYFPNDALMEFIMEPSRAGEKYVVMSPIYRVCEDMVCSKFLMWTDSLQELSQSINTQLNSTIVSFEHRISPVSCEFHIEEEKGDYNYWSMYFNYKGSAEPKFLYGVVITLEDFIVGVIDGPDENGRYPQTKCLLKAVDGHTLLSRGISNNGYLAFRPVRDPFEESMENVKRFQNVAEMKQYIIDDSERALKVRYRPEDIVIKKEGIDDIRNGWRSTHYVCVTHMGKEHFDVPQCIGWCTFYSTDFGYVPDEIFARLMEEEGEWKE